MDSRRRVFSAALSQEQDCWRVRAHRLARGLSMRRADMNRAGEPVPKRHLLESLSPAISIRFSKRCLTAPPALQHPTS
jgi:hypothetical protein